MVAETIDNAQALDMAQAWQAVCSRKVLLATATHVAKLAPKRATIPVLENMMLRLATHNGADVLRLTATTFDTAISLAVACDTSDAAGMITANARDIVKWLKASRSAQVTLSAEYANDGAQCWLTLTDDVSSARLSGIVADEFPLVLMPPADARAFDVPSETVQKIATRIAPCAAEDESRPTMLCVNLRLTASRLAAAATDGYQLAVLSDAYYTGDFDGEYNVPAKAFRLFAAALPTDAGPVRLTATETYAWLDCGAVSVVSRLVEAKYIGYQQIVPLRSRATTVVEVRASELLRGLKAVPTHYDKAYLRLTFDEHGITIDNNAGTAYPATARTAVAARVSGPALTAWFALNYATAYLAGLPKDAVVTLRMTKPQFIVAFEVAGDDATAYYCMPVQPER